MCSSSLQRTDFCTTGGCPGARRLLSWPDLMIQELTVQNIADLIGAKVEGDGSIVLEGIAPLESAHAGQLTFAIDEKWAGKLARCKASAAIVGEHPASAPMTLVRVDDVPSAMATLLGKLTPQEDLPDVGVHPSAVVDPCAKIDSSARIGSGAVIGAQACVAEGVSILPGAHIERGVSIGSDSVIGSGVTIRRDCVIGSRVRIGPNSVIGYDGFGYFAAGGVHHKIPHAGNVVIEDDVEIGACSCVDRAKFGSTRIGEGTKIDNLVQVAHNVRIGRGCILAAMVGIASSARLGDYVIVMGSAGIRDNVKIGSNVQIAAYAAVAGDIPEGQIVAGIPAGPVRDMMRVTQATMKLPDLLKRVRDLEARLAALESSKDNS